ncbi:MAG: 3-oxoacyl-ACP reductase FabG [Candidatus Bathyarchaeota archaeon]|nr:3-oxoacyl-ACP reductase FabG [Candidatus Bathyarchaeota archaeon]
MPGKLVGRIALVTGSSRGIGEAIALSLGEAGATLALVSRDAKSLGKVSEKAKRLGIKSEVFAADVSNEADVEHLKTEVLGRLGAVNILVNNAGINIRKPLTEFTPDEWRSVIDTNLVGPFLICRAFVPAMKGRGYGRIINITSTMSHVATANRTAYAASKSGLLGFTRALALELAPEAITVNGISPGWFETELTKPIWNNPEANENLVSRIPLGKWGDVNDIGKLATYLCSDEAGYITGTDILIDGGYTAQ